MFTNNLLQLQTTDGSEMFEVPLLCVNQTQSPVWDNLYYANVDRKAFLYSEACIKLSNHSMQMLKYVASLI
jgi:hypothetical protein